MGLEILKKMKMKKTRKIAWQQLTPVHVRRGGRPISMEKNQVLFEGEELQCHRMSGFSSVWLFLQEKTQK